jgi:preflagellin peptidase FlaK
MVPAYLDTLSAIACATFLIFGSWSDLKTREVSNKVWAISLPIVAVMTATKIYLSLGLLLMYVISMAVSIAVSFAVFEIGFFGGADAKAMITLAVAFPLYPEAFQPILGYLHPFFPLIVFTNSYLLSLTSIVYVLVRNVVWKIHTKSSLFEGFEGELFLKKLLVLLSGYKVELSELRKRTHLIPIEDVSEDGKIPLRKMRVFVPAEEDRNTVLDRLEEYVSRGLLPNQLWVTPGLPMLVFIAFGFAVTLVIGDALFYAIYSVARLMIGL